METTDIAVQFLHGLVLNLQDAKWDFQQSEYTLLLHISKILGIGHEMCIRW